jgi:hypothetical protein
VPKGAGSRAVAVAMAYKLLDAAQERWRQVDGPELVALVHVGARFTDGKLIGRADTRQEKDSQDQTDEERAV